MNSAVANLAASREGKRHRSEVDIIRKLEDLLPFWASSEAKKADRYQISED